MKTKLAFIVAAITAIAATNLQKANAQNTFPASGNVGIGTTTPQAPLHVKKSSAYEAARFEATTNLNVRFYENNTYRGYVGSAAGNAEDVDFGTGGTNTTGKVHLTITAVPKFTLDPSGRIGIGTTIPASKLDIVGGSWDVGSTEGDLRIGNATYRMKVGVATGGGGAGDVRIRAVGGTNRIMLGGGTADVLTIVGSGNVGIGTITPGYRLDVCGTIRAKEIRVETGWCDYVFDKAYKLKSIEELEQYINTNKHLPGIAPATEVENNGLKVGEMNKAMMEKIEELTLYIIQLSKENKQLKTEVDALKH